MTIGDLERMVELRARRDELVQTLTKVVPIVPPPPHIFAASNVQRFRDHIRGIFVGGDNALTTSATSWRGSR